MAAAASLASASHFRRVSVLRPSPARSPSHHHHAQGSRGPSRAQGSFSCVHLCSLGCGGGGFHGGFHGRLVPGSCSSSFPCVSLLRASSSSSYLRLQGYKFRPVSVCASAADKSKEEEDSDSSSSSDMFDDLDDDDSEDSEDLTEEEMNELAEWELDWDSLSEEQADAIEQIFLQEFGADGIEELTKSLDDTELAELPVWVKGRGWVYPGELSDDDEAEDDDDDDDDDDGGGRDGDRMRSDASLRHMDSVLLDESEQPNVSSVRVPRGSAAALEASKRNQQSGSTSSGTATRADGRNRANKDTNPHGLDAWQLSQLQSALAEHGRRGFEVSKLSKKLGLGRRVVLEWLKENGDTIPKMAGDVEPRADKVAAAAERKAELAKAALAPESNDWRGRQFGAGKIKKKQLVTLDAVFAANRYPSEKVLRECASRTKLPQWRVRAWFAEKRGEKPRERKSTGARFG